MTHTLITTTTSTTTAIRTGKAQTTRPRAWPWHPAGWLGRVRHALSELLGGHSHDAADQIDDALEANSAGRRALVISHDRPRRDGSPASRRGGGVGVGGVAGRHLAQRGRRVDRGAAAGGVHLGASTAEQAVHLRLRPRGGPRRPVRGRDDPAVQRGGRVRPPSSGCCTRNRSAISGRWPVPV